MVHVKVVVVFIFNLMSVFLQLKVEPQPTTNSFEENSCPQLDEEWRIQAEEYQYIKLEFEKERQKLKTLENVSHSQSEEIQRLNVELENEGQSLKTLENVSNSQSEEIQRLNMELENEGQSIRSMEKAFHSHCKENQRLNVELENERRLIQNSSLRRATVKLIKSIRSFRNNVYSVIKVQDEIYVLWFYSNWINSIKVFEDRNEFHLLREININVTDIPFDMVYSNESKCFYIYDSNRGCIWQMTTGSDHRLTKWLTNVTWPGAVSLSIEGHLLMLRRGHPSSQLEIYLLNSTLVRSIQLPNDIKKPSHVVQTSAGYYVILHELTGALSRSLVISQVNSAGQLVSRFTPINQFQVLYEPRKLFYDSVNHRLFVADLENHRVVLFDSNCLNWIQVLVSQETERIRYPWSVFYDANKRQLLVSQEKVLDIFELS